MTQDRCQSGQTLSEYTIVLVGAVLVSIGALMGIESGLEAFYTRLATWLLFPFP